jgi:uncharacterized protein
MTARISLIRAKTRGHRPRLQGASHLGVAVRCAFLLLLLSPALVHAAETPIPPSPTQWVTDTAHFMSPGAAQALNSRLQEYEQSTGHQLIVYIGQTTGDAPIEDWAVRAFAKWKVGRKGLDDGLALFIMAADRKLRIEVGYGLEPVVPDAIASRVINDVIVPRIQANDRDGAVTAGMDAVMTVIGGGGVPRRAQRGRGEERPMTLGQLIGLAILGIVVLFVLITNPSLALYLLASILSGGGGRGGGWGGGGGGFGGGGGRSGGGGASGSW